MRYTSWVSILLCLVGLGCSEDSGGAGATSAGICQDTCLKSCGSDSECAVADGELCCDYGADGKACVKAKSCPRFCASDARCDSTSGEACLRTNLESISSVCTQPQAAVQLCQNDAACGANQVCCTIYKEPVCLGPDRCPQACATSSDCSAQRAEVCCTTLNTQDPTLAAAGLCVDPKVVACPTACAQSSDCDTASGELCCDGTCSKKCVQKCSTSSECRGQICCQTPAARSPFVRKAIVPGYAVSKAVVTPPARMDAGAGSAGGGVSRDGGAVLGDDGKPVACAGSFEVCGAALFGDDPESLYVCVGGLRQREFCATGCQAGQLDHCLTQGEASTCLSCAKGIYRDLTGNRLCSGASRSAREAVLTCGCGGLCNAACGPLCDPSIAGGSAYVGCNHCLATNCAAAVDACIAAQ